MVATEKKHVYLKDLHFEHRLWLNELDFVRDEMSSLSKRLAEVQSKNTDPEFEYTADSLQNRLIRQKEVVGELRHTIKTHETSLAHYAEEHPIAIDHVYFTDHQGLRERMTRFTALYTPFKAEFMNFIAKWM
jgi:hypothetical protein